MEERPRRKRRSDQGPRVTERALDALEWIAQQYAVSFDHLMVICAKSVNPNIILAKIPQLSW
jgi:hypothetical protein